MISSPTIWCTSPPARSMSGIDPSEVRVQHRRDLVGVVLLGEAREAREVGEHDAHVLRAGERLVEVEGAEALLVPLRPRDERDEQERREHEDVPLPPRDLPVPRPRDDDHRLGEEHEREREGEDEALLAPAVEPEEPERGDPVERDADRGEERAASRRAPRRRAGRRAAEAPRARRPPSRRRCVPSATRSAGAARSTASDWLAAELERRRRRERSREHEADRRRELEAGVRAEQDAGRRERVEPEEGRARR